MPKGYWIVRIDINNPEGFKVYAAAHRDALHKYGAKFIVRGGKQEALEGHARSRNVVLEFKDYATALACYHSLEYKRTIPLREPYSDTDFVIVEGYDGPQP